MKNLLVILFAAILTIGLTTACGDKDGGGEKGEAKTESSSGNEVDKWLDDYEVIVDKSIEMQKKQAAGEEVDLEDASELIEKSTKFLDVKPEFFEKFTTEQQDRFQKLVTKSQQK